jgi:hypothetical protein
MMLLLWKLLWGRVAVAAEDHGFCFTKGLPARSQRMSTL